QRRRIYRQIGLFSGTILLGLSLNAISGHADNLTTTVVPATAMSANDESVATHGEIEASPATTTPVDEAVEGDNGSQIEASHSTTEQATDTTPPATDPQSPATEYRRQTPAPTGKVALRQPEMTVRQN